MLQSRLSSIKSATPYLSRVMPQSRSISSSVLSNVKEIPIRSGLLSSNVSNIQKLGKVKIPIHYEAVPQSCTLVEKVSVIDDFITEKDKIDIDLILSYIKHIHEIIKSQDVEDDFNQLLNKIKEKYVPVNRLTDTVERFIFGKKFSDLSFSEKIEFLEENKNTLEFISKKAQQYLLFGRKSRKARKTYNKTYKTYKKSKSRKVRKTYKNKKSKSRKTRKISKLRK